MGRLARSLDRLKPHYDVVVVGSGYGGGIAASRLSRAGKAVAVLERGREYLTGEFPSRFSDLKSQLRVASRRTTMGPETALFDVRLGDDMHVMVGCGLGGGSLVNAGVSLRPDERVFADTIWPDQLRQDGLLDEGFRRVETWLQPATDPAASERTKFKALDAAGRTLGQRPVPTRVAVGFQERVNAAGILQPECTRCGDCVSGCNVGAKNSVALTYLPDAVRHGAELFAEAKVRFLSRDRNGRWEIHIARLDGVRSDLAELSVTAEMVVLGAGTLGSTEILLRSRERGLAVSDCLGHRFSANGDLIAFGFGAKAPVHAVGVGHPIREGLDPVGASVSGQIEIDDAEDLLNELRIQEGVMPSPLAPMLPVLFLPNGRLLGALKSLITGVYKGPFASLQTFFAVSHDSASGRFHLDGDRLELSWPGATDEPVYARLDDAIGRLVREVGGSYVRNPLAGTLMGHQPATAHPLGGCAMGRDRTAGVVDHKGRVFDGSPRAASNAVHQGLYVVDGAAIPRSLGVNPLLTISALAERAMVHLAADHGLNFNADPVTPSVATPVTAPGLPSPVR